MGNFELDWQAKIVERDFVLKRADYLDQDGNPVNKKGYIIDESTKDIRSKFNFEVVFKNFELAGEEEPNEIPVQFRIEKFNFNPHQCFGNFDYDLDQKPIIFKDKFGVRIDNNLRKVN